MNTKSGFKTSSKAQYSRLGGIGARDSILETLCVFLRRNMHFEREYMSTLQYVVNGKMAIGGTNHRN
jgi:hypothetical protein